MCSQIKKKYFMKELSSHPQFEQFDFRGYVYTVLI